MFNLNHAAQLTLNVYYVVQCLILQNFTEELCLNFKSAKEWVKCSDYLLKVKIVHSLGIGTISIMMIHLRALTTTWASALTQTHVAMT